ncbi:hypothetical protein HK102_003255 [Quaeritorhiza haematococci]|nr:hypothetical protein HK102_003255 [Quaeritorhiza haematococci]
MSIPYGDLDNWVEIGSGAFGKVYRADYLGTDVAVKEFFDIKDQPEFDLAKYTSRELDILKEARHPNVVQYMGSCIHNGKVYVVTEFVEGGDVSQWISDNSKPLPWSLRISFAIDVARALAYLHARNIIHRVAPRTAEEKRRLSFCGTNGYMAPEIILGMPFDTAVDIFSFGVILCEIACRIVADTKPVSPSNPVTTTHPVFKRVVPGFGLNAESIRGACNDGCPRDFLSLALECADDDKDKRPTWKEVLRRLRVLEQECGEEDRFANVGILLASITNVAATGSTTSLDAAGSAGPGTGVESSLTSEQLAALKLGGGLGGGNGSSNSLNTVGITPAIASVAATTLERGDVDVEQDAKEEVPHEGLVEDHDTAATTKLQDGGATPKESVSGTATPKNTTQHEALSVRVGHEIPHRFSIVKKPTVARCELCAQRIGLGLTNKYLECDDCGAVYHRKCAAIAPRCCGLPTEVKQSVFNMILNTIKSSKNTGVSTPTTPQLQQQVQLALDRDRDREPRESGLRM